MSVDLEIRTEREEAVGLFPASYSGNVLRVRCRLSGKRRWGSFLLVPDEGDGWEELEAKARPAAISYLGLVER